jgi:hypothetical protein
VYVGEQHIATLAMFGNHGVHGAMYYTVPISSPGKRLTLPSQTLEIQVRARPSPGAHAHGAPQLTSVRLETM